MFVRVDSLIYVFPLFYAFFFCHIVRLSYCSDLLSLAFVSTVYRFVYKSGRHGRYPMLVRFTATYAISAYQR